MKILVVDVGGTNLKMLATGHDKVRKTASGLQMTAHDMVEAVRDTAGDWEYDVVTIGYPGAVVGGKLALEPRNLAPGWVGYDFEQAFGRPVKLVNDAAMQALGSYDGGRMLFLSLGTGLGSALIVDGVMAPLELAHLPYKKGRTFEDYVGERAYDRLGKRKWEQVVADVVGRLKAALIADYVVIGGGNVKRIQELPHGARRGDNQNAIIGGYRMWKE